MPVIPVAAAYYLSGVLTGATVAHYGPGAVKSFKARLEARRKLDALRKDAEEHPTKGPKTPY